MNQKEKVKKILDRYSNYIHELYDRDFSPPKNGNNQERIIAQILELIENTDHQEILDQLQNIKEATTEIRRLFSEIKK